MTAAQDLNTKLRLESVFRASLEQYQRRQVREFTRRFGMTGNPPNFADDNPALEVLLFDHYVTVGDVFSDQIRGNLPEDVAITDNEEEIIAAALLAWYLTRAPRAAAEINTTTQEDAGRAMLAANEERADNPELSALEAAAIGGAVLNRSLTGRLTAIVMTETQVPAETAKATEADVLSGLPPPTRGQAARQADVVKEWVSIGDSKVRPAHLDADGQKQPLNDPFIVGGQLLRWPGDEGLGATADNIINCRCGAEYDENGIIRIRRARA